MLPLLAVAAALLPLALSVPVSLSHVKTASTGPPPPPTPALGFDYLHLVQVMQPQTWCCNSLQQRQRKDTRLPPAHNTSTLASPHHAVRFSSLASLHAHATVRQGLNFTKLWGDGRSQRPGSGPV